MTQEEVLNIFRETGALLEGHFVLTSGFHSPHYFQCAKVLQYPEHLIAFSEILAHHFENKGIDVVISPAVGGIVLGTEIGRILKVRTIFAEREKGKLILRRGFELKKGEKVLAVEDVVTTGGSVFELIEIIKNKKAVLSGVGFVIDRSNGTVQFGCHQISLAKFDVIKFADNEIPEWLE
ncbi:MAG: orotate phosphoribosyltransferase, partial [Bacteroidota bacterium]|nr:orotate phosphoribosyltransferase [Bacteroidota bacterium]